MDARSVSDTIQKGGTILGTARCLEFKTEAKENDFFYDEIGSVLEIKKLQNEKRELMEALEMFYRVVFLGEEFDYDEA